MDLISILSDSITIDLHDLRFIEAKTELFDSLEGYFRQGFTSFEIIHGFRNGSVIRKYVRYSLKKDFERRYKHCVLEVVVSEKGSTRIVLVET